MDRETDREIIVHSEVNDHDGNDQKNDNEEEELEVHRDVDFEAMAAAGMSEATIAALRAHLHGSTRVTRLSSESEDDDDDDDVENTEKPIVRIEGSHVSNHKFKNKDYWEERFETEESYDWLATFKDTWSTLQPLLNTDDRILVLGCGNSTFSEDLYDQGFHHITNIDFSATVISHMQEKHGSARPLMKWICMDMTKLEFPKESFDVVIDKAAMDALMVDEEDVWYPKQSVVDIVDRMCLSVGSVLKTDGGKFIQISFAQPHFRTKYLMSYRALNATVDMYSGHSGYSSRYDWTLAPHLNIEKEAGCLNCFAYIMIRNVH